MASICYEERLVVHVAPLQGAPGYSQVTVESLEVSPSDFDRAVRKVCTDLELTPKFVSPVRAQITMIFPERLPDEKAAVTLAQTISKAI